jgi:hypothetical protein
VSSAKLKPVKYTLHEDLSDKKGVISNTHGFLDRSLDGGFKTKWSGYWAPPYKFLDYFSFRVNGIWLNKERLEAVEYGKEMVYHYETDSMIIHEKVSAPESFPGLKIDLELENKTSEMKAVQIALETGINIRSKDKDVEEGSYAAETEEKRILVSRNGRKLAVESAGISGFEGERFTREHYPGEKQVCLVPEKPVFRREIEGGGKEDIEIKFKTSEGVFDRIDSVENDLEHKLGRSFQCSVNSLENMIYSRNGTGVIAGHPWFQSYWARDSFWSVLGLIDAGYFETSEKILENFAENDLAGKIDLEKGPENDLDRDDTGPLFIIASEKLRRHYGITEKIEKAREKAMGELELEDNVVQHSPCGTWMDTIKRSNAVDIQALWLEAARIMDDDRQGELEEGMKRFKNEGYLKDELGESHQTVNTAIPLMFGHLDRKTARKELERINGEFSSRYGARTRSVTDPGYDSSGYHTGSVWGLTTCWAAAANFRYGKDKEGCNFLEKLEQFLDRNQPGALPEVVDAESGELLGTPEQTWSAGMFVHIIDSYMLGIEVYEDYIEINPAEGLSCTRKGKNIRGERLDLRIENGDIEVLNDPDLDLRI